MEGDEADIMYHMCIVGGIERHTQREKRGSEGESDIERLGEGGRERDLT
jgi:hypothetical protein